VRNAAVLVVGTYRDVVPMPSARSAALAGMIREYASSAIQLRPLGAEDIPNFVERTSGCPPSESFAGALLKRSGGNPLYLHQLLKTDWAERALNDTALAMSGSIELQQPLIVAICRHVDELSAASRELLTTAAVLGEGATIAALSAVSHQEMQPLLESLDEAISARLLVRSGRGEYRFAQTLVRDVLYKRLSSVERGARHRAIAEALLAHYGEARDVHATELAHHFFRAWPTGDPERAVEFSCLAARHETARGQHREAIRHWERAVDVLYNSNGHNDQRLSVQLELARAHAQNGDERAAREAFLDATILARALRQPEAVAEAEAALDHALASRK
jgi:predicted ATPase